MLGRPIVWVLGCTAAFATGAILWRLHQIVPDVARWVDLALAVIIIGAGLAWPRAGEQ